MIVYSLILFSAALLFLFLGIRIFRGKTDLIHDYHQTHVGEAEKKEYGRSFAKGMFCISATLTISGGIALLGESKLILFSSLAVLSIGLAVSIIRIYRVQKKYNGGIFP